MNAARPELGLCTLPPEGARVLRVLRARRFERACPARAGRTALRGGALKRGAGRSLLLLASLVSLSATALSQGAQQQEELLRLFQVDLPSADVLVLLDASGSMRSHGYGDVRQAVVDFAPTLTDKETLHLRVFGDAVSAPLEGAGNEVAGGVNDYLPQEPRFQHTDLGLAISKGLEFLERERSSRVQAFFLLTDGLHEPPADSPYSRDFNGDPNWQALRRRAQALCQRHTVFVYGFGLGQQTDINVLRRVFPAQNVEVVVGGPAQVAYALRRVREGLRWAQLRQAVEQELSDGSLDVRLAKASVEGDVTEFEVPLTIRNDYRHLPVSIEQINVQRGRAEGQEISCMLEGSPSNVVLEAGQQWQGKVKGTLNAESPGWRLGKSERPYSATFRFVPVVHFRDEAALGDLGADTSPPKADAAALAVSLRVSYGIPFWPFVVAFLLAAAVAGFAVVSRKQVEKLRAAAAERQAERRRLAGRLIIWRASTDEPDDGVDMDSYGEESLTLAVSETGDLEISDPGQAVGERVARLSAHLVGSTPDDGESGKLEFQIEAAAGHRLAYKVDGEKREAERLTLYHNDLFELDGRWRLHYVNLASRPRYEAEAAR